VKHVIKNLYLLPLVGLLHYR